jgi:SAM-dependent methyltransferase
MSSTPEEAFGRAYASRQIERQRNPFRQRIKSWYIARVLRHVEGKAVDLGCGAGQILERLPAGSLGIEVNPFLVEDLTQRGLRVMRAAESAGGFDLSAVPRDEFGTLVLSHVLEHFDRADQVLRRLLHDCADLGMSTVIVVVPGASGFRSDPTHQTFVDLAYLRAHALLDGDCFRLAHHSYFPGNLRRLGQLFVYHELMLVYRLT